MLYIILSLLLALIAVLLTAVALKTLLGRRWIMAWLRGTASLLAIAFSLVLIAIAWDFLSYGVISDDQTIATVAVKEVADKEYQITVALPEGEEGEYSVKGDQWQLDVRMITWSGPLAMLGLEPGYRLDRLSGRYISLEDERAEARTVYDISGATSVADVWSAVNNNAWLPWVKAKYGSATYLPMKDGALYAVLLNNQGPYAKPLNEPAESAVNNWQ
ncbi:hypothetical protein [Alkalimarinus coralli]|uniref:hypothetical protein n=1 Tax=Alkalimarinus coralli TaxID=2935863 RepID=UPI00202AFFEB|nr:hypothetical protein [Alkalimarinus coralli]